MFRHSYTTAILILFVHFSEAQTVKQYSFTHYSTASGLISNQVYSVVQDDQGYMWIATTDGLQRFDGVRYRTFRHKTNDPFPIPTNPVIQLIIDGNKNLWILTGDGRAGIFDRKRFTFHEAAIKPFKEKSVKHVLKKLVTDRAGRVFLMAGADILLWNENLNEFSAATDFLEPQNGWYIIDFIQQPGTKKYWVSVSNRGIFIYNDSTKALSYAGNNTEKEVILNHIAEFSTPGNLFFDSKGRLWFDTWGPGIPYLHCYDLQRNQYVIKNYHFMPVIKGYYELHGIIETADGSIWVKGLNIMAQFLEDEKTFQQVYNGYFNDRSISYEEAKSLFEDREKNIWVGTSNNGLYRFNPSEQLFTNTPHINRSTGNTGNGSVMSFMNTTWGTILTGTWGDGVYQYDMNLNLIPLRIKGFDEKTSISVWSMFASRDSNTIWMSCQPGVFSINQAARTAKYYNPPALENRTVRQIAEDKYGNLWLGMQSTGLYKWSAEKGKINFSRGPEKFTAIPSIQITRIIIDSKAYVWVCTSSEGVYVIDPQTDKIIMHFNIKADNEKKLPEEGVSSVLEYDDSTMIITTATRILIYNRISNKSQTIGTSETISGFISTVEKDNNGYLWIATTNGLYRLNIRNRVFVKFNREDGIDNEHFTTAASLKLPDGRMLFGSTREFILFDPLKMKGNESPPNITVTDFKIMNRSLLMDSLMRLEEITLRPNENSLSIEFSPLVYSNTYLIKYKLEGLDKDWKTAEKNNEAVYSYLPPGSYTFLLQALDAEGNTFSSVNPLTIKVNPPFWKSWWFFSALILTGAVLLYWFDRERMKRKEAIQKMRIDIATNLNEEVNIALNNINILSEMARLKAKSDTDKAIEYIEQINTKSQNMIIAMDDVLWSITPENDSMPKSLERMKEYIDALRARHNVQIDFAVDKKVESLNLSMKLRQEAFWLFKRGIANMVKTGARNCCVHIGLEKANLVYSIEFDNQFTDAQQLNNLLQRHELEKRLKNIKATLDVKIHKTKTSTILTIPVG